METPLDAAYPAPRRLDIDRVVPRTRPPQMTALDSSSRAQSTGHKPSPKTVALRRVRSAPVIDQDLGAQRFTDLLLQHLTGDTAAPLPPATPQVFKIPFGVDPRPRATAAPRPGKCSVCLDDQPAAVQMCWNKGCDAQFCPACIAGFADEAVSRALYAVPWLRCPGCSSRVPTASWAPHAQKAHATYCANAQALLTFRCGDCHEVGTLLYDHNASASLEDACTAEQAARLTGLWEEFAYAVTPPETLLDAAAGVEIAAVLACIEDVERRTCLQLAWLRRNPFIETACCQNPFCFKCKVGSHHEDMTCEERQRQELDILCQFCPDCEVPTVRTEGCDHIVCVCGAEWTWQETPEAGQALGPAGYLRDVLASGVLDPNWANTSDGTARTVLMYAVMNGRLENVRVLIAAGADVNARDGSRRSALLYALGAINGIYRPEAVSLLLEHSAEVWRADPMLWITASGSNGAGTAAFGRLLPLSGISVDDAEHGGPLLQVALTNGRHRLVQDLMENHGARVDRMAPFWFISAQGLRDTVLFSKVLAASCLGVNDTDSAGSSLVQCAMMRNKQDLVRYLVLEKRAQTSLLEIARPAGFWPNQQVLPMDLYRAVLEQGIDVFAPGRSGGDSSRGWLLALVVRSGAYGASPAAGTARVRRFVRQPAPVTRQWVTEFMGSLLEQWNDGADRFAVLPEGAALLTEAVSVSAWDVVERLIAAGAWVNSRDASGSSPLHFVVADCNEDGTRLLLKARANVLDRRTLDNVTPLAIAEKAKWNLGISILKEAEEQQRAKEIAQAAAAAASGDGSLGNVGIRLGGELQCPQCRQRFGVQRELNIHRRFMHDPSNQVE